MNSPIPTPYVGPRTFLETEKDFFFGRDREARDLLALVVSEQLVVFYAQSGAGKSSLVNTRLIPDLRERGYAILKSRLIGDAPEGVKPGNIFVFNLLRSLAPKDVDSASLASQSISEFILQQRKMPLQTSQASAEEEEESIALIIDQFEEVFSTHDDEWQKREGFFLQLAQALEADPYLSVVLVMREDFIASLDPYSSLVPGRFRRRYYMQRLERDAALTAIKEPVMKISPPRPFEDGVAERLVDDLSGIKIQIPGEEPITQPGQYVEAVQLQVACLKLWKSLLKPVTTQTPITHADLDKIGKVDLALEEHYADRVREVADRWEVNQRLLREWFGNKLITPNGARNMVLRDTRNIEGQLKDDVIRDLLGDLVRMEPRGAASFYELTHDRLVEPILSNNRKWFQSILERQSVLQQKTSLWADQKKNKTLLSTDDALAELKRYADNNPDEVTDLVREYLDACREKQEELDKDRKEESDKLKLANQLAAEQERAAREQAHAAMWAKRYTAILGIIAAIAIAASIWAVNASQDATEKQNAAETAKAEAVLSQRDEESAKKETERQAQIAQSGALISSAEENSNQPDLAMLLKLEAFKADENPPTRREIIQTLQQFENLEGFINPKSDNFVINPNGSTLANLDPDGITVWDLDTRRPINPTPINGHSNRVYPTAINPEGTILVSGDNTGDIVVWDLATRQPLGKPFQAHPLWVDSLAFTPDGRYLASASDDQTIILWDMANPEAPKKIKTLSGHNGWIASLAISSDGKTLASGGSDNRIFLWDISDPQKAKMIPGSPLEGHGSYIYTVAFAQQDTLLISASADATIRLWNVNNPGRAEAYENPIVLPEENYSIFYSVAPSPDGNFLVAGAGTSFSLWKISDPKNPELIGQPVTEYDDRQVRNEYIYSTIFLGEDSFVTSSFQDILIWKIRGPEKSLELATHFSSNSGALDSLAYDPATKTLISGNFSGAVVFWNLTNTGNPSILGEPQFGHPGTPTGIEYHPFGAVLNSTGDDGNLLIDAHTLQILGFGDPSSKQVGNSMLAFTYRDVRLGTDVTRIYAYDEPEVDPFTIPGNYLDTDRSVSKIVYETAGNDGEPLINVWDLDTNQAVLTGLAGEYIFSPGGEAFILTTTDEAGNISGKVWSTSGDGKLLAEVEGEPVTLSPNGKYLYYRIIVDDTWLTAAVDVETGAPLDPWAEGFANGASPDGRYLAIASETSNLSLLDTNTNQIAGVPIRANFNRFSDDGRLLAFLQNKAGVDYFGFIDTRTGELAGTPLEGSLLELISNGDIQIYDYYDKAGQYFIGTLHLEPAVTSSTPLPGNIYQNIPNQNRLIYSNGNSLNLLDTSTGNIVGIPREATFLDLSPDETILVYQYSNPGLGTYGIGMRNIITGIDIGFIDSAEYEGFTADGRDLVYRMSNGDTSSIGLLDVTSGMTARISNISGEYIDYLPAKNWILTKSENGLVNVWNVSKDQLPGDEPAAQAPVTQAVLSPDGNTLGVIQEGFIQLKNAQSGALLGPPFNHHLGGVHQALTSPNGRFLLSSGQDGKAILWDVRNRTRLGLPWEGIGAGFSSDSRAIIILDGSANRVTFYNTSTYESVKNPITGSNVIYNPARTYFAIVNETNNVTTLWNNTSLEQIGAPIPGTNATFSPGGKFLAVGDGFQDSTSLWTLEPFTSIPDIIKGDDYEFNADDKFLVAGTNDYYTTLYRLTSQSARGVSDLRNLYNLYARRFSPDGRYFHIFLEGRNELWDLYNMVTVSVTLGDGVSGFSPNGKYAAITNGSQNTLWSLSNATSVSPSLPSGRVEFSPNNRYLSVGTGNEIIFKDLFDSGQSTRTIEGSYVVFSPDDKFAAVLNEKELEIFELPGFEPVMNLKSDTIPAFTPDGRFLIHPDLVYDLLARRDVIQMDGANFQATYSPDRKTLYIFGNQGITTWAINTQTSPTPLLGHTGNISNLMFSPDGKTIASIGNDGIVLTDTVTGVQHGNTFVGSSIAFNKDGITIAISAENETTLWDISDLDAPSRKGEVIDGGSGIFSPNGELIVTTDKENNTYIRDILTRTQIAKIPGAYPQFNPTGDQIAVINAMTSQTADGPAISGDDSTKDTGYQITILDLIRLQTREIPLPNPCPLDVACIKIVYSPAGNILAYNEPNSSTIHILDAENSMESAGTIKIPAEITNLHIVDDNQLGTILIVETTNPSFVLYDVKKRKALSNPIPGDYFSATHNGDVTRLIYRNNTNRNLIFWDILPKEWISRLCQMVSRNLTRVEWKDFELFGTYHATCPQWEIEPEPVAGN